MCKLQIESRHSFGGWLGGVIAAALLAAAAAGAEEAKSVNPAGAGRKNHACESTAVGQWNIMVVPARQTVYSACARERFEKHCASCHSKDGRAQTPVARQRHVRDLSESTLTDEEIIAQILLGTHGKVVDFRMPPFSEKLGRASIEELVPVVKAFRPASPNQTPQAATSPRLAGIVNFPNRKAAILEKVPDSGRYFLLGVNERHDGAQLLKLKPYQGTAQLSVSEENSRVTLKLDPPLVQASRAEAPGFPRRLFSSGSDQRHSLALDHANTHLVLFLYAQLTGRTVLCSPRLPATTFSLTATGTDHGQIARRLENALAESGIASIPDGSKFLLVVPTSEVSSVRPRSSELTSPPGGKNRSALFLGGAFINFPDTEVKEVLRFYADLTGHPLDQTQGLPLTHTINFTTQTPLNPEECAYALETLIGWQRLNSVSARR